MTALSVVVHDFPLQPDPPRTVIRPRPAAPRPRTARLGLINAIRALRSNPITAFAEEAFQAPILEIGRLRKVVLVNDPDDIEHVLVGNAGNYRKSL